MPRHFLVQQEVVTKTAQEVRSFVVPNLHDHATIFLFGHTYREDVAFVTAARADPSDGQVAIDEAVIQAIATGIIYRALIGFPSKDRDLATNTAQELAYMFERIPFPTIDLYPFDDIPSDEDGATTIYTYSATIEDGQVMRTQRRISRYPEEGSTGQGA